MTKSSSSSSSSDSEATVDETPAKRQPRVSHGPPVPAVRPKSARPSTAVKSWSLTHSDIEVTKPTNNGRPTTRSPKVYWGKRSEDTSSYAEVEKQTEKIRPWQMLRTADALPPRGLTVTSVSQNRELQAVIGIEAAHAEGQTSTDWLHRHSIEAEGLAFDDIMKCGIPIKAPADTDPETPHLKLNAAKLQETEFKLKNLISLCQERINWLLRGSRRAFGMVKGQRVGLLVDTSDANCGYGRLQLFQESLLEFIEEQLVNKDKLFLVSFGTHAIPLWTVVRDNNCRILEECRWWVKSLRPQGGCNVIAALKQILKRKELDSIVLVLGNCPDQNPKLICEYVRESLSGRNAPLHTVAYDCSVSATNMFLKELAEQTDGRYHCYVSTSNDLIMTGTDLHLVAKEMEKAQEVLRRIQQMKQGVVGNKMVKIQSEVPLSLDLPKIPMREGEILEADSSPLVVEHPSFPARTSSEWLSQHGLKAKGLNMYQVLAPNAYSYVDSYVSSINKNIHSLVHERSMTQFKWHDGTLKNVHVDPTRLFDYQRHLESAVQLYKRRTDWLSVGCRKIFGTVVEKRVILILDSSMCMTPAVPRLQEHIRLLLEQQMANKTSYNLICFGDKTEMFRPVMVEPSPEYLEATWKWLLQRSFSGSRNFLDAFRKAVENEEERSQGIEVEGVYLITSGVPDEPKEVVCGFISEALAGRNTAVHTIYYEVDDDMVAVPGHYADRGQTADYLRQMAHVANGRFHWYRSGAVVQSDDLRAVIGEMDKAFNYSQKASMLLESVRKKKPTQIPSDSTESLDSLVPRPPSASKTKLPLTAPRHTALTKARMKQAGCLPPLKPSASDKDASIRPQTAGSTHSRSSASEGKARPLSASSQALCWKPPTANSSSTLIPAPPPSKNGFKDKRAVSTAPKLVQQVFYTEMKNETGAVFSQYPTILQQKRKSRQPIKSAYIPDKEENVSTREWMRHYSLSKLKLDLNSIVGTAECSHAKSKVNSIGQSVPARYCNIFPSVEVKGVVKHLHLMPHELEDYEDQVEKVMRRYIKRLQWLMSGSRRVFGTIVEKNVIVLVDTSGSMVASMDELKRELAALVWDQIKNCASKFNLVRFSSEAVSWKPGLVAATEAACQDAVEWLSDFQAIGSTCTLDALQIAFEDPDVQGIYLLTDGKPDNSTTMVLREVAKLNSGRNARVHSISFNCDDSSANKFLQLLASQTGGRFHRCQGDPDGHMFTHRILTEGFREDEPLSMPVFEGDDLRRLASEIALCRKFLLQSRSYRAMFPDAAKSSSADRTRGKTPPVHRRSNPEVAAVR